MSVAAAGRYDDRHPRFVRYWDGQRWTEDVHLKKSALAGRGGSHSEVRWAVAPQARRAARASEQTLRTAISAAQDRRVEKVVEAGDARSITGLLTWDLSRQSKTELAETQSVRRASAR